MYWYGRKRPLGLLRRELDVDRVPFDRLLQIIKRKDVRVLESQRDTNAHGEFRFVQIVQGYYPDPDCIVMVFYGHGYWEHKERHEVQYWRFYRSYLYAPDDGPGLNKWALIERLKDEQADYEGYVAGEAASRSNRARMVEMMADLADDDMVLTMVEDMDA